MIEKRREGGEWPISRRSCQSIFSLRRRLIVRNHSQLGISFYWLEIAKQIQISSLFLANFSVFVKTIFSLVLIPHTSMSDDLDFYVRYYVGHKGKFGHEFLEFEFNPDGKLRYANNSHYKNETLIRKEGI